MAHSTSYLVAFSAGRVFYMSEARRDITDAEIEERARWWSQEMVAAQKRLAAKIRDFPVEEACEGEYFDGYVAGATIERDALQVSDTLQQQQKRIECLERQLLVCSEVIECTQN